MTDYTPTRRVLVLERVLTTTCVDVLQGAPGCSREGEVVTRGPHTMRGYWRDAAATAAAVAAGGWLRTGDIGRFDAAGALHLCGHRKDMIKCGGENVHAAAVEAALCALPGVAAAAVVPWPHARLGEAPAALLHVPPPAGGGAAPAAPPLAAALRRAAASLSLIHI